MKEIKSFTSGFSLYINSIKFALKNPLILLIILLAPVIMTISTHLPKEIFTSISSLIIMFLTLFTSTTIANIVIHKNHSYKIINKLILIIFTSLLFYSYAYVIRTYVPINNKVFLLATQAISLILLIFTPTGIAISNSINEVFKNIIELCLKNILPIISAICSLLLSYGILGAIFSIFYPSSPFASGIFLAFNNIRSFFFFMVLYTPAIILFGIFAPTIYLSNQERN